MTHRIVVGVDGSPHSNEGLRWAIAAARRLGDTKVVAVFAWELPLIGVPGAFDQAEQDEMEARAKRFLNQTVDAIAPDPPVTLERIVARGEPTISLIEASRGADLLVVGSRGRNAFRGLLLGSVSQGCAADAACPVVVVKLGATSLVDGTGSENGGAAVGERREP